MVELLISFRNPDLISAILNSWSGLVKLRPGFVQIVVSSLTLWTPAPLLGLPFAAIKSVEKSVRILLTHISRCALLRLSFASTRIEQRLLCTAHQPGQTLHVRSTKLLTSRLSAWNKPWQTREHGRLLQRKLRQMLASVPWPLGPQAKKIRSAKGSRQTRMGTQRRCWQRLTLRRSPLPSSQSSSWRTCKRSPMRCFKRVSMRTAVLLPQVVSLPLLPCLQLRRQYLLLFLKTL